MSDSLDQLLSKVTDLIVYEPLASEVPLPALPPVTVHTLPADASTNPAEEAVALRNVINGPTAVLVPGRQFDATGTRHGRGGGWYDRFLAEIPREWTRIGVCYDDQFSSTPLTRESWDQPMDHVLVVNRETEVGTLYSAHD